MTADEFKKELFWTFNLNLTKEGEAKLDKLIERITKARIEQKHIYITGRPKVRPSEEEVNGLINKYCEIHGTNHTTIGYYLYSCKSITVNLPLQGAKYVKYKRHERKNQAA